jgi:hypothetical protein
MPPTKKELIVRRYMELTDHLRPHLPAGASIFPPIDEIDVVDLVFYLNLFFETSSDYRTAIKDAMSARNIEVSDAAFDQMYPFVEEFLVWLKQLS